MTHKFKIGDKVKLTGNSWESCHEVGDIGVITQVDEYSCRVDVNGHPSSGLGNNCPHHDLTPHPAPIGYTGKLKDMDLQEGDVVKHEGEGNEYTMRYNGGELTNWNGYWGVTISESTQTYTLISRANEQTHYDRWSNWNLSKQDGSFHEITGREYQTEKLGKTKQVAYRSRKVAIKEPVVTTHEYNGHWDNMGDGNFYRCKADASDEHDCKFTITLKDGVPVSMVCEFIPKTANQS